MPTEKWECRKCGLPCRIEIEFTDEKLPAHLKGGVRFRDQSCFCQESRSPEWQRVDKNGNERS